MNPIDQLKAVLCDPSGKCCIDGPDEDRAIIDKALQALSQPRKEWVGLTDDEHWAIANTENKARIWFVWETEAKLKEKNT